MNVSGEQLSQLASLFLEKEINRVIIFVPPQAKLDTCASAIAWKKILELQQKEVSIISSIQPSCSEEELPDAKVIIQELGKDNLIVHFPYLPDQVDKITSHIGEQTNRFYLTIKPKTGVKPISLEEVELGYAGASADVLILLDINSTDQLEPYFAEFPDLFRNTPTLVISQYGLPEIGVVKLETQGAASLSEETTHLFLQLGWEIESNAATALLRGIEECTQWLASPVATANTFEAVAALLRAGAKRQRKPRQVNKISNLITPSNHPSEEKSTQPIITTESHAIPPNVLDVQSHDSSTSNILEDSDLGDALNTNPQLFVEPSEKHNNQPQPISQIRPQTTIENFSDQLLSQKKEQSQNLLSANSKPDFNSPRIQKNIDPDPSPQSDDSSQNSTVHTLAEVLQQKQKLFQANQESELSSGQDKIASNQIAQSEKTAKSTGHYLYQKNNFRRKKRMKNTTGRYMGRKKYSSYQKNN